jgi:hypothetical protein
MGYFLIGEFKEGFDMKLKKTVTYKKNTNIKK